MGPREASLCIVGPVKCPLQDTVALAGSFFTLFPYFPLVWTPLSHSHCTGIILLPAPKNKTK